MYIKQLSHYKRSVRNGGGERAKVENGKNQKRVNGSVQPFIKQLLLFITLAVLAVGGGAFGSFMMSEETSEEGIVSQVMGLFKKEPEPIIIQLEPFVTNLKPLNNNRQNVISTAIALEVIGEEDATVIEDRQTLLRDSVLQLLNNETIESVYTKDDTEGLAIKQRVKQLLNEELGDGIISNVFITDIVTQ